jgi:hypothetical protein
MESEAASKEGAANMNLQERPITVLPETEADPKLSKEETAAAANCNHVDPGKAGSSFHQLREAVARFMESQNQKVLDENGNLFPLGGSPPGTLRKHPQQRRKIWQKKHLWHHWKVVPLCVLWRLWARLLLCALP